MSLNERVAPQRRRGRVLEEALLDAAWAEVVERGYDEFTMDAVAERAGTSRAVLYRRWPNKQELVRDTVVHEVDKDVVPEVDTGSLRGDVLAVLRWANSRRVRFITLLIARLSDFYRATGTSLADLASLTQVGRGSLMGDMLQRAADRGEIRSAHVSERIARLPGDLFRYEILATFQPVPDEVIEEIVDTIFLPLVRAAGSETNITPG